MNKEMNCIIKTVTEKNVFEAIIGSALGLFFGGGSGAAVGAATAIGTPTETIPRAATGFIAGAAIGVVGVNVAILNDDYNRCMQGLPHQK